MKSFNIIPVAITDSTNHHLKYMRETDELPDGTVILADYQSNGRGRDGNVWYSGKELNVLMSVLMYPDIQAEHFFLLTEIASLALIDLLKEFNIHAEIKWPNDIYVAEKKIAGILIENILNSDIIEASIIGIGLNVNESVFPDNLPNPVSIRNITQKDHERRALADKLLQKIMTRYNELIAGQYKKIHNDYNSCLFRKNKQGKYSFGNKQFQASVHSVLQNGILVLEDKAGELKQFTFGELEMIL
jgi:BirA family biotin operon repressor/biotin-[acetyl-CoA-carboxylase] ligase